MYKVCNLSFFHRQTETSRTFPLWPDFAGRGMGVCLRHPSLEFEYIQITMVKHDCIGQKMFFLFNVKMQWKQPKSKCFFIVIATFICFARVKYTRTRLFVLPSLRTSAGIMHPQAPYACLNQTAIFDLILKPDLNLAPAKCPRFASKNKCVFSWCSMCDNTHSLRNGQMAGAITGSLLRVVFNWSQCSTIWGRSDGWSGAWRERWELL